MNAPPEKPRVKHEASEPARVEGGTAESAPIRERLIDHVDNSPLAVLEWGDDSRIRRWTGQAPQMFGWRADEVVGRHLRDWVFVHPDDLGTVENVGARLIDGREQRNVSHNRNFTKEGGVLHCVWYNSAVRDMGGRTVSILSLVQDVTEHVLAEETLRENERLYHTLIEATNTGYVQMDARGDVLEANHEYVRLTGRTELSEVLGHRVTEWIALHDYDRMTRELEKCAEVGLTPNLELEYITPEGRFVPVEINGRVRQTSNGMRIMAFCRDISDRRRAQAERQTIDRKLQETQKLESLGVLAGGIAHDFNNLLTGILGNASLASMDAGAHSPAQSYLQQIELGAMRAADLCRQMLAYSGKGRFVVRLLDLNAVLAESTNFLQASISKSAVLQFRLAPALPPLLGDATQIRQVIMNLVMNASEAIGDRSGYIVVSTAVMRADREYLAATHLAPELVEGNYVALDVSDTGSGMTLEVLERIFDPFFTTKFTGRGLGLAAVLGIVRGHRGALKVESEPERGTKFRVLLPCAEGPVARPVVDVPAAGEWRGRGTVLLVEDEETVRVAASRMLEALGFKVIVAVDGRAGVEEFASARDQITLVLLDLTMPHMDGEDALAEMRRLKPDARVLLMSGYDEQQVVARFEGNEPAGFIHKPFKFSTLREKLQEILARDKADSSRIL